MRYNKLINCNKLLLPRKLQLARKSHGSLHSKVSFTIDPRFEAYDDPYICEFLSFMSETHEVGEDCELKTRQHYA